MEKQDVLSHGLGVEEKDVVSCLGDRRTGCSLAWVGGGATGCSLAWVVMEEQEVLSYG